MKPLYTKAEYQEYVNKKSPNSKVFLNNVKAFFIGGLICVLGQIILDWFLGWGFSKEIAANMTTVTLIFLGATFTGLGVYDKIGKFAGAGSIVPITGFANSVVSPAIEYKSEGYIMGLGAKIFTIAGPVLVYGIISSVIVGIIYFVVNFI